MHLIAKVIRISHAKFHCNRLTTVQHIQDYASLIFWDTVYIMYSITLVTSDAESDSKTDTFQSRHINTRLHTQGR